MVVLVLVVAFVGLAARQISLPLPTPVVSVSLAQLKVPGTTPQLPWPRLGAGAVRVPSTGFTDTSGSEGPVPIASLTKLTTALVILRDHPLPVDGSGPTITLTAADAAKFVSDVDTDQSTVAVVAGEVLTERQMLEGLLIRSANNLAYTLAVWDAGSEAAFVVKMNAMAASLGMKSSHYVDASGFADQSVSSAADVLRAAAAGMDIPTFAQIVSMPSVSLPEAGTLPNIVTEVGTGGVIGIKSGITAAAGACIVLAARRLVAGRSVLVLAAVTGQVLPAGASASAAPASNSGSSSGPNESLLYTDPLLYAGEADQVLLEAAEAALVPVTVSTAGGAVGTAAATPGGHTHRVPVVTQSSFRLVGLPGQVVTEAHAVAVAPDCGRGCSVGWVNYTLGAEHVRSALRLDGVVPKPSWDWRLLHLR